MLEISIIIPVYNAESYIERCLQSIISSSVPEGSYEIIAVDDSSSDRSLELLQKMERNLKKVTELSLIRYFPVDIVLHAEVEMNMYVIHWG